MAKESFEKEVQFLRLAALTSGAYNRRQFADRLGISIHTFDKTLRKMKDILATIHRQLPGQESQEFSDMLRFNYYDSADPMLLFLYRAKSLKETEIHRLSLIISSFRQGSVTALELLEQCSSRLPEELALPDEKTIRADLRYLEEVGVIRREPGKRPYRYTLHNDIIALLSDEELKDLYAFVDVMANTQIPSVHGYLLRESLKRAGKPLGQPDPFLYRYHYYSRILDEAHLFTLLRAIKERRKLAFLYFSTKNKLSYGAKNTNPLFQRDSVGKLVHTMPIQVIYDHQYGRWYLIGTVKHQIAKFRLEGITEVEQGECIPEALFQEWTDRVKERLRYSWLIDTGRPAIVRARFFNPDPKNPNNFVKERVLLQGQWGKIIEEDTDSFIYEIKVNGTMEIKPWLRSFGSSCEVLAPQKLREEFIQEWKEIQAYYEPV